MYIINTSFFVEPDARDGWLEVINGKFIPFLKESGFDRVTFTRVISAEPVDTFTYSLMVEADDMEQYGLLKGELFGEYHAVAAPMFDDRVLCLTTLLKKMD